MRNTILVVDDEESIRFTVEKYLVRQGFDVLLGETYGEAIDFIARQDIAVIVSDIILGGNSGIEFLREIKTRGIRSPVIMMTGKPNLDTASEAVRLGAFDYLAKPFKYDVLLRIINRALQHKKLDDEKESYRRNLEAIFISVSEGIITVDRNLAITQANDNIQAFFNVMPDEIIGKNFIELDYPGQHPCTLVLQKTLQTGEKVIDQHAVWQDTSGKNQSVIINSMPLWDKDRKFIGGLLVLRDTTPIARLEQALKERYRLHRLIGKSSRMQELYGIIDKLSDTDSTVLITGESGTGKELVAEAVHYSGSRANKPLIKVNCNALSENLLESELFGHVTGAFTGAAKDKTGRFQLAHGGTIFLDEIGEMSTSLQLKLLRVLQEKEFERVGDSTSIKVDVRVIAATNSDLAEKIKQGAFRQDLYYRLKVIEMSMPPLRERKEDIRLLVDHFLSTYNKKLKRNIEAIAEDVLDVFMNHTWPGNVRELEHVIERACIMCHGSIITREHLPEDIRKAASPIVSEQPPPSGMDEKDILCALEKARWNKTRAAQLLGVHRSTLHRKMKELNLEG